MLSNEYRDLLQYLENQDKPTSVKVEAVKPEKPRPEVKEESTSDKTKRIIEECQDIYSDIPLYDDNSKSSSKGFVVEKFEALMRAKLVDEDKRLQSYERPYISVTELYDCLRQKYYNRMKYTVNIQEQYRFSYLYLINQVGNLVHDVVQSLYGFSEVEKTIVSEKFKVKGRVDAIKDRILYEFKTIDPEKFKNKYIKEHEYQGMIYAYILNTEYGYDIDTITIVYILRNLKRIAPFDIPYNSEVAESFLKNAITLRKSISAKKVPEPLNATLTQCTFCQYKKFCEDDQCTINRPFTPKKKKKKEKSKAVFAI